jgi:hypothetical protein
MNMNIPNQAVLNKYNKMSPELQEAFNQEYNKRKKSYSTAIILTLINLQYVYLGKWLLFFLYICTFMGFGIWWIADLCRMKSVIEKHNQSAAIEAMREVDVLR